MSKPDEYMDTLVSLDSSAPSISLPPTATNSKSILKRKTQTLVPAPAPVRSPIKASSFKMQPEENKELRIGKAKMDNVQLRNTIKNYNKKFNDRYDTARDHPENHYLTTS